MIEQAMFFGLGFLAACLIAIFVANAVWRRAVRLTTKRLYAAMPVSLVEIKADRDQLRAEFAVSTRRLEMAVEELKKRSQAQLAEIGGKNEQLRVLLAEIKERAESLRAVEEREKSLRADLLVSEARHGEALRALKATEERLATTNGLLAERETELADTQAQSNSRRIEIAALQTNAERLRGEIDDLMRTLQAVDEDRAAKQSRLAAAELELAAARTKLVSVETAFSAAEETAHAQAEEVGRLQARIVELTGQISGHISVVERQSADIHELSTERDRLAEELARRTSEAETRARSLLDEIERFRTDRASLEGRLAAETAERLRLSEEIRRLEIVARDNWDRERVENALLRERMNDLAGDIARMTATLDDERGAVEQAALKAEADIRPAPALPPASGLGIAVPHRTEDPRRASLAERVRALKTRAAAEG